MESTEYELDYIPNEKKKEIPVLGNYAE